MYIFQLFQRDSQPCYYYIAFQYYHYVFHKVIIRKSHHAIRHVEVE